jgi:hypothetical protein
MQPMYLPWAGYFNLIAVANHFYYLDDAQYERGTWQHRNRILLNGQPQFLTVPVRREHLGQQIDRVQIDPIDTSWRRKHAETIRYAYRRAPHWGDLQSIVDLIGDPQFVLLADLNIALTEQFCALLSIATPRARTAALELDLPRSPKIIELCRRAGCDEYLSPRGAAEYLAEDRFVELSQVRLTFQEYDPAPYVQGRSTEFVSHLSIVDVIAHLGAAAAGAYVRGQMEQS